MGVESILSLKFSRVAIGQMAKHRGRGRAGGRDNGKNGSSSDTAIAKMTWERGDCLLIPPVHRTFNLVINKGDLYCVVCSSDHIERRIKMYRD